MPVSASIIESKGAFLFVLFLGRLLCEPSRIT